jgi:hypothetical protein
MKYLYSPTAALVLVGTSTCRTLTALEEVIVIVYVEDGK